MLAFTLGLAVTPADDAGLLFNDADDAPVPLVASVPRVSQTETGAGASTDAVDSKTLTHPSEVPPAALQRAVDWVCSSEPFIGIRRHFLKATGINLGPSRRERELRQLFLAVYRLSYDQRKED